MRKILVTFVPGLVGACLGGVVGYYAFSWITRQGFFALVVPGALVGLACGFCSVNHSRARGILAGLLALVAGVVSYWHDFSPPFDTDGSLTDLVMHLHQLPPITQFMLALGTFLGFWWGRETTSPLRHRFAAKPPAKEGPLSD